MQTILSVVGIVCIQVIMYSMSVATCTAQVKSPFSLRILTSYGKASTAWDLAIRGPSEEPGQDSMFVYGDIRGHYASQTVGLDYEVSELVHIGVDVGAAATMMSGDMPGDTLPVLSPNGTVVLETYDHHVAHRRLDMLAGLYAAFDLPWNFYATVGILAEVNISNNVSSYTTKTFLSDSIATTVNYDHERADYPTVRFAENLGLGQSIEFDNVTFQWLFQVQSDVFSGDMLVNRVGGSIGLLFRM